LKNSNITLRHQSLKCEEEEMNFSPTHPDEIIKSLRRIIVDAELIVREKEELKIDAIFRLAQAEKEKDELEMLLKSHINSQELENGSIFESFISQNNFLKLVGCVGDGVGGEEPSMRLMTSKVSSLKNELDTAKDEFSLSNKFVVELTSSIDDVEDKLRKESELRSMICQLEGDKRSKSEKGEKAWVLCELHTIKDRELKMSKEKLKELINKYEDSEGPLSNILKFLLSIDPEKSGGVSNSILRSRTSPRKRDFSPISLLKTDGLWPRMRLNILAPEVVTSVSKIAELKTDLGKIVPNTEQTKEPNETLVEGGINENLSPKKRCLSPSILVKTESFVRSSSLVRPIRSRPNSRVQEVKQSVDRPSKFVINSLVKRTGESFSGIDKKNIERRHKEYTEILGSAKHARGSSIIDMTKSRSKSFLKKLNSKSLSTTSEEYLRTQTPAELPIGGDNKSEVAQSFYSEKVRSSCNRGGFLRLRSVSPSNTKKTSGEEATYPLLESKRKDINEVDIQRIFFEGNENKTLSRVRSDEYARAKSIIPRVQSTSPIPQYLHESVEKSNKKMCLKKLSSNPVFDNVISPEAKYFVKKKRSQSHRPNSKHLSSKLNSPINESREDIENSFREIDRHMKRIQFDPSSKESKMSREINEIDFREIDRNMKEIQYEQSLKDSIGVIGELVDNPNESFKHSHEKNTNRVRDQIQVIENQFNAESKKTQRVIKNPFDPLQESKNEKRNELNGQDIYFAGAYFDEWQCKETRDDSKESEYYSSDQITPDKRKIHANFWESTRNIMFENSSSEPFEQMNRTISNNIVKTVRGTAKKPVSQKDLITRIRERRARSSVESRKLGISNKPAIIEQERKDEQYFPLI